MALSQKKLEKLILKALAERRSLLIRGYLKEDNTTREDLEVLPLPPGQAYRQSSLDALAELHAAAVKARLDARQCNAVPEDEASVGMFLQCEAELREELRPKEDFGTVQGSDALVFDSKQPGLVKHASLPGVVLLGVMRVRGAEKPEPQEVPDLYLKKGAGLGRSAVKKFILAYTPRRNYIGRLNLYDGRYDEITLGEPVQAG